MSEGRPKNSYRVIACAEEPQKIRTVHRYLREHPEAHGVLFCRTAERAANVARYLQSSGIAVELRLSGTDVEAPGGKARPRGGGRAQVVIIPAGIEVADLPAPDFVVHYNLPRSLETYRREADLAGDGERLLLYSPKEVRAMEKRRLTLDDPAGWEALVRFCEEAIREMGASPATAHKARIPAERSRSTADLQRRQRGTVPEDRLFYKESRRRQLPAAANAEPKGTAPAYFDRLVADAVYTLIRRGVPTIFAKSVMELLSGNEALTLRPERKQEVEASIRRLMAGGSFSLYEKYTGFGYDPKKWPESYLLAEQFGRLREAPLQLFAVPGLPTSAENLCLTHYVYRKTMRGEPLRLAQMCKTLGIVLPEETYYRGRKEDAIREKVAKIRKHLIQQGLRPQKLL